MSGTRTLETWNPEYVFDRQYPMYPKTLITLSRLYPGYLGYSVHMLSISGKMPGISGSGYVRYSGILCIFDNRYPGYPNFSKRVLRTSGTTPGISGGEYPKYPLIQSKSTAITMGTLKYCIVRVSIP